MRKERYLKRIIRKRWNRGFFSEVKNSCVKQEEIYGKGKGSKTKDTASGEYLYGFRKKDRLYPVITFVLYSGEKPWDAARSLHEILDFTDVPESL